MTFTTAYSYSSSNFADYLQPSTITESASNHSTTRVTNRTFDYGFTSNYILPKVASSTVTVASEAFATAFDYNHGTGFLTSQTALGRTTSFSSDSFGNLASVTDSNSHETTTSYQWGVPSSIATPGYTVARSINDDGWWRAKPAGAAPRVSRTMMLDA